ncbi:MULTISPECIES: RND family transporter [unclassified Halanaerobium]|uniref:efflux RND transporter permease subunit n=1 Tax=unclassified Halanaerobium TaxID=2641197 RepID=UPI000DF4BC69|nr:MULTISPECIES: MMPL family transporter [unclassified Halanaerobium]RCW47659.1 hypothetical protein DFR78_1121 [Halanaerobium sp. MA284_MarDTE_T2]RCW84697.1 hypothetical protein DER71_11366 [Halanaerobium sp. DL-01]
MNQILKYNKIIVIVILLITIFFAFQIPKVEINNDIEVFLPDDHFTKVQNDRMKDIFGESDSIVAAVKVTRGSIFDRNNLSIIDNMSSEFEKIKFVDEVTSITNVDFIEGSSEGMIVEELVEELPEGKEDIRNIKEKILSWDLYKNNLYSEDFKATQILISLDEDLNNNEERQAYYQIKETADKYKQSGIESYISGSTAINVLMGDNMVQDIKYLIPFIIAVLIITLYLFFDKIFAVFLIMLTVSISSIWSIGLMAFLGINMTLVSTVIPVLLIAVGSAYGIHILSHYYDYINDHNGELSTEEQKKIVLKTVNQMEKAVFLAALTTAVGFGSLASSDIVPIKTFGIFTAVGIAAAFLVALFLIPSLLILTYQYRDNINNGEFKGREHFSSVIRSLHDFYAEKRISIMLTVLIITAVSFMGFNKIIVDTPLIEMFREDTEIRRADNFINENFSGTNIMKVMVEGEEIGDLNHPKILTEIDRMQNYITDNFTEVGKTTSIVDYIKRMNQVMHYPEEEKDRTEESISDAEISEETTSNFYKEKETTSSFYNSTDEEETATSFYDESGEDTASSFYNEEKEDTESQADREGVKTKQPQVMAGPNREKNMSEYDMIMILNSALIRAEKSNLNAVELVDLIKEELNYKAAVYYEIPSDLEKYNAESQKNLQNLISQYLLLYSGNVDDLINDQIEPDKAQILLQLNDPSNLIARDVRKEVLKYAEENFPKKYQTTVTGNAAMALEANNLIVSSQTRSIIISFIIVFLIVSVSFKSLIAGIYGIIPLAFSLIINFGLMGHLGIKLDVGTAMVASIAIGIGVDYTIHFLHTYYAERRGEDDLYTVTKKTLSSTGKAIIFNAISVAAGFLVLLFSNFYPLVYLGFLIAVTMFTSSIASLTILPLLLNIFKPKFISKN